MEAVSWLFSISSYGSLPWAIICPVIAQRYGRKAPYVILWINTIICVSLLYFSKSVTELFGATFYWGIWISNAIGTFFHWKNICILIFICCIYNISILFWPDSPVWLATNGRFEECARCHRWLKGEDEDSELELKQLISSQKENLKRKHERKEDNKKNCFIKLYDSVKAKTFYIPLIYSLLTICLYHFSGKLACSGYIIDIIKTITASESTAYEGMLVLDGVLPETKDKTIQEIEKYFTGDANVSKKELLNLEKDCNRKLLPEP
ncbi:jg14912 [Pararge aegeria aegeria]|uniref:Jg14912 protein n=1 Tax=Pararge aegeria aegeria TaxID=348720 RepID=A0A8S4R9K0_9NEOP|nr:jg14912 [Pararge aegeria aegeria]